jgi:hypothetical protein
MNIALSRGAAWFPGSVFFWRIWPNDYAFLCRRCRLCLCAGIAGADGVAGEATAGLDGTGALSGLADAMKLNIVASAKRKTARKSFVMGILQIDLPNG